MTPHPGCPRLHLGLQTDDPGHQWDDPGHLWEEPGGWTTLESPPRDASLVNSSAALDPEDKIKERSITDDEDEDGNHRKVSAAQYQLFRQAVTTSKGSFKVNPAKTSRASRASLLYLGDSKVTERVSWLDQPSLKDADASNARIAQGLKEDEEIEKKTLSETLNTTSSTFKHLTVKQIFPREPYRLEVHRDAQYVPKLPGDNGFSDSKAPSSYQMSHRMCLDTEELARRSAIYASLADALLKNFGFQPQVLSTVRTAPLEGSHVLGPEPKVLQNRVRAIRQADRMAGSSVTFTQKHRESKSSMKVTSSRKTAFRTPAFDQPGSPTATREEWHRSRPFQLAPAGEPATDPTPTAARSLTRFLRLPQPGNVDGSQVGARLADFAPHWWSLLGNCRATAIVEDGVGIAFQQRPQLTHQCISFRTRNSGQDLQQAVDVLLMKGAIERVTNVASLGYFNRLFMVPKKTGDLRPVIDLSTLNRHMLVPHLKMEMQWSVCSAIRSQEWTVSLVIHDAYLHVPMHQAVFKYLPFRGQQESVHLSSIWAGDFCTRVHKAATACRSAVKAARYEATCLLRRLADQSRYSGTGQTARPDASLQVKTSSSSGCSSTLDNSQWRPYRRCV